MAAPSEAATGFFEQNWKCCEFILSSRLRNIRARVRRPNRHSAPGGDVAAR